MGKITTPTYRVEFYDNTSPYRQTMAWRGKSDGRANAANLESWRTGYNASFQHDGVNAHLARSLGKIPHIHTATLVHQASGRVIARVKMPMFEVV
jgi:hypothetical protein